MKMFLVALICLSTWAGIIPSSRIAAQTADGEIRTYIDKLEKGQAEEVKKALPELAAKYENNPGVIYLQGRLASNGIEAVKLYETVVTNFPRSEWADDALYRIYQYYYAMGLYRTAEAKLQQLKRDYPNSPHALVTMVERPRSQDTPEVHEPEKPGAVGGSSGVERHEPVLKNVDTAAKSPRPVAPIPEKQGKYSLQVGAFTTAANAEKQKRFFERLGYAVEITNKVRGGKSLFVVLVGSFAGADEAKTLARQVKSKYKIDSMVVEK